MRPETSRAWDSCHFRTSETARGAMYDSLHARRGHSNFDYRSSLLTVAKRHRSSRSRSDVRAYRLEPRRARLGRDRPGLRRQALFSNHLRRPSRYLRRRDGESEGALRDLIQIVRYRQSEERHLEGRDPELKETVIAIEVFGRPRITIPSRMPLFASKRDGSERGLPNTIRAESRRSDRNRAAEGWLCIGIPPG